MACLFDGSEGNNSQSYNSHALPDTLSRGNSGASTHLTYDNALRVEDYQHQFTSAGHNMTMTFGYNPAFQVTSRALTNLDYLQTGNDTMLGSYGDANGLNQYQCIGGSGSNCAGGLVLDYDDNGNLDKLGTIDYGYDTENRLVSVALPVNSTLDYDANGRLNSVTQNGDVYGFVYDGNKLVAEYLNGIMTRRFVHGNNTDQPLAYYTNNGVSNSNLYYLHSDHQGSIVAHSDHNGVRVQLNAYDEFGVPNVSNSGRFGYTGQMVLPNLDLYHYKARVYHPRLGRFLQTDPVGYEDQMNLYTYVANDPMTNVDPSGEWLLNAVNAAIGGFTAWEAVKGSNASAIDKGLAVAAGAGIGFFTGKAGSKGITAVAQHFTRSAVQTGARATATVAAGAGTGAVTGAATEAVAQAAVGQIASVGDIVDSAGTGAIAGAVAATPATVGATGVIPNTIGVLTGAAIVEGANQAQAETSTPCNTDGSTQC